MKKAQEFIKQHWFEISILLILILAIFLRFYNYENRWGLAYDQAHNALVARYALEAHKIPLLGPFSSSGPFQTGGEWYWLVMLGTIFNPFAVETPWIFMGIISVIFVLLMMLLGREMIDKKFGLFLGLLSAVSTAQIAQSTNLTNQTPIAIFSLLAIFSMVRFLKTKKPLYLFLLSLSVGIASSMHLQGIALVPLILITLIFSGRPNIKGLLLIPLGILIPWMPVFLTDAQNNFDNTKNMFYYYFLEQNKPSFEVLGRRWLTFLGVFLPNAWAHIIGGNLLLGYITVILSGVAIVYSFLKRQLSKEWYILVISFLGMLVLVRYTRTPLFDSFIVFTHPFIFLFTALAISSIYKKNVILGISFLFLIVMGSFLKDINEIKNATNYTSVETNLRISKLFEKFPNERFSVYAYRYKWVDKNLPLSLFLDVNKKIDDGGRRIGVVVATKDAEFKYPIILGDKLGYQLLDLNSSSSAELSNAEWVLVNPKQIYRSTEEWYIGKKL